MTDFDLFKLLSTHVFRTAQIYGLHKLFLLSMNFVSQIGLQFTVQEGPVQIPQKAQFLN